MPNENLKPCPFCGGVAEIVVSDCMGRIKDKPYEFRKHHRNGLGFVIRHAVFGCPVGSDFHNMGYFVYGTREEAIEAWNKREESVQ